MAIDPNSPEFFEDFDPFEFDGKKDYVDGKSDAYVNRARANRLKALNPEWLEKNRERLENRNNNPEFKEKHLARLEKMHNDPTFQEKNQKAHNKPISCDGIIFSSRIHAAYALAPATRSSNGSKSSWLTNQMIKYPERYFYIIEDDK